MSNIIGFLEHVGQDSALRHATTEELQAALDITQIAPSVQAAILANDRLELASITDSRVVAHGVISPGKEDDEDDEAPDHDDDEIRPARVDVPAIA